MIPRTTRYVVAGVCLLPLLGSRIGAIEPDKGTEAPALKISLKEPERPIHPGETLSVAYVIKNMQPRPLLLAINQGETGGQFAARTLSHRLVEVETGKTIESQARGWCPVGEGFKQHHFHELAGGAEYGGTINVRWGDAAFAVPRDFHRGEYRLEVKYLRGTGSGGQFDEKAAEELWKKAHVASSNSAVATLRVADWDDTSIKELRHRISSGEPRAMMTASIAQLDTVLPDVSHALLNGKIPPKHQSDFQHYAINYLRSVSFPEASDVLVKMLESPKVDYRIKYEVMSSLASFPDTTIGPWAIKKFHQHSGDRLLQDKYLGILIQRKYTTDDPQVIAYMLREVRSATAGQLSSSVASYMLDGCAALGSKNTRPVTEEIRRRLDEIPSVEQQVRLAERIDKLLQD